MMDGWMMIGTQIYKSSTRYRVQACTSISHKSESRSRSVDATSEEELASR
mgnify:CR=1 FL=1